MGCVEVVRSGNGGMCGGGQKGKWWGYGAAHEGGMVGVCDGSNKGE